MEESLNFIPSYYGQNATFSVITAFTNEDTDTGTSNENKNSESGSSTSRNAARERSRVRSLRAAFHSLQRSLPSVPQNTKLSKLDVLVLAANYISHLSGILQDEVESEFGDNRHKSKRANSSIEGAQTAENSSYGAGKISTRGSRNNYLHPVKKWPIRSRLYAGIEDGSITTTKGLRKYSRDH